MISPVGGTGGACFRKMYGNFLIEAANKFNDDFVKIKGDNYLEISEIWDSIAADFYSIYEEANTELLNKISIKLNDIYHSEELIMTELQKYLGEKLP